MKTKNTAVFLIVACIIWLIKDLNYILFRFFSETQFKYTWIDNLSNITSLLIPIGLLLWAFTYVNPRFQQTKAAATLILIGSSVWCIFSIYYSFLYFSKSELYESPLNYLANHLTLLFPVSLTILAILLFRNKPDDLKKATYWLFAGSLVFLFSIFASQLMMLYSFSFRFYNTPWESVMNMLSLIRIVYPLAILFFAIQLIRSLESPTLPETAYEPIFSDAELIDTPESEKTILPGDAVAYPTLIDWISDFLRALIPVFGLVFLFWRGQNKADRTRRNWAIAHLFVTAIYMVMLLLFFFPLLEYIDPNNGIWLIFLLFMALLLVSGFILAHKMRNDDYDYPHEQPDAPTVGQFLGWTFVAGLPVAGLICLIIWAVDTQNRVRRQWALASLLWMGIMAVYYLYLYNAYHGITSYMRFSHF